MIDTTKFIDALTHVIMFLIFEATAYFKSDKLLRGFQHSLDDQHFIRKII